MVSVLAWIAVDRRFEPRSGKTKDYTIGMCYFSAKQHSSKEKMHWLAGNQNNVLSLLK